MSFITANLFLLVAGQLVWAAYFELDIIHHSSAKAGPFIPLVSLGVGTPPQTLWAILDTGSSELVIPDKNGPICRDAQQQCVGSSGFVTGAYDRDKSSSAVIVANTPFSTSYTNGVAFRGLYVRETVTVKGQAVVNSQLAVINNGTLPPRHPLFPIFGVGPKYSRQAHDNVPAQMVQNNLTKSNAYSLYLNDFSRLSSQNLAYILTLEFLGGRNGAVIFGGVDYAKFSGQLKKAPLTSSGFVIQFSSLTLVPGPDGSDAKPVSVSGSSLPPALIDSGNPGLSIPADLIHALASTLRAPSGQRVQVPCNNGAAKLVFGFHQDSIKIEVPLQMLILPAEGRSTGSSQCLLAIEPGSPRQASLGAPFLQAAYVVFDAGARELMLAQAVLNATSSDIREYP